MARSKTLSLLLTFLLLTLPLSGASRNVSRRFKREHRAMHWIVTENRSDAAGCTATAIGPHALLTAQHCDLPSDGSPVIFLVDPIKEPDYLIDRTNYWITGKVFDGSDHMILLVSGPAFADIVPYDVAPPRQGEMVAWFGNPLGIRDQFREGYVSGATDAPVPFQSKDKPQSMWRVAAGSLPGDSGSLVFDEKTQQIVGIVTYSINDGTFMGMFVPHFSASQILSAQLYDGG